MPEATIYHLTTPQAWDNARATGVYKAPSLEIEGFIHCSTRDQVLGVANARFKGRQDLVLLCIDSSRVQAPIQFDAIETGARFPHIYGPLNADAVIKTVPFTPGPDGTFALPTTLPDEPSAAGR